MIGPDNVSPLERCPHFRGWYVQASMELGPDNVSLLERCPHFRGWYVQASMELGPEDVSLLERCPHFRGWYIYVPFSLSPGPPPPSSSPPTINKLTAPNGTHHLAHYYPEHTGHHLISTMDISPSHISHSQDNKD